MVHCLGTVQSMQQQGTLAGRDIYTACVVCLHPYACITEVYSSTALLA